MLMAIEARGTWPRTALIILLGAAAAMVVLSLLGAGHHDLPKSTEVESAAANCDSKRSGAMFTTAQALGIVRGADLDAREGMVVIVDVARWRAQGLERQKTLAAAIDCSIAGPQYLKGLHFRQDRSGPDLYGLEAYQLLALREAGYSGRSR
jgi:hypothetical protein